MVKAPELATGRVAGEVAAGVPRRRARAFSRRLGERVLVFGTIAAFWQVGVMVGLINRVLLPSPSEILRAFVRLAA